MGEQAGNAGRTKAGKREQVCQPGGHLRLDLGGGHAAEHGGKRRKLDDSQEAPERLDIGSLTRASGCPTILPGELMFLRS